MCYISSWEVMWVCNCEDNVIGIAGGIMSMYTDSVTELLVTSYLYYCKVGCVLPFAVLLAILK